MAILKIYISVDGEKCIDVVKCKHCDYELKYNTSTSGMSYHIRNKPRQLYKDTHIAAPGHTVKESIKGKSACFYQFHQDT